MDPLEKNPDYDPYMASVGSAYVSAFNDYVRKELKFGEDRAFKPSADIGNHWSFAHGDSFGGGLNVMADLASAMKYNPNLKVLLNAGYYDLATPYFQGVYEMQHLPMAVSLQKNIEYQFYESGHMVYANEASLRLLHDTVADFIRRTATAVAPRR